MSETTEVSQPAGLENPFPDKLSRKLTLKDLERSLLGHRVPPDKVHIVLELIKEKFPAEGLPEEHFIPQF